VLACIRHDGIRNSLQTDSGRSKDSTIAASSGQTSVIIRSRVSLDRPWVILT
jgi:hypothetical protein